MDIIAALHRLGGIATYAQLARAATRAEIDQAVRVGEAVRLRRGMYALLDVDAAAAAATRLSGDLALRSAALAHGWQVKTVPDRPEVMIDKRRNPGSDRLQGVQPVWRREFVPSPDGVTSPLHTVIDAARMLPFDEALAIVDSALRAADVTPTQLRAVGIKGRGARAARKVIEYADARAANPFESVLRALAVEVGLEVLPQQPVTLSTGTVHPDLVVAQRAVALEADSWTFHATREGHRKDCVRYNLLTLEGWVVLRFTWEQLMFEPQYVRWVLQRLRECLRGGLGQCGLRA